MRIAIRVPLIAALVLPTFGLADSYPHHNFNFGLGAGVPRAQIGQFFDTKPGLAVGYGYRFHPFFQADIGFDAVIGAANVNEFTNTVIGARRVRDFQYFLPLGGRAILPLANGRLQFYGGGGGTYMRYQEQIKQPGSSYYRIECPDCTSRSGWGYYATAGFTVFLDRRRLMRIGVAPKIYRGHTDGQAVGPAPGIRTRDHWVNVMAEFGISF